MHNLKKVSFFFRKISKVWLDCLFPPLCTVCRECCSTKMFCPECWDLCSLPDPENRCRHCFVEIGDDPSCYTDLAKNGQGVCRRCRKSPRIKFPSAFVFEATGPVIRLCNDPDIDFETLSAFALIQWFRLSWSVPNLIIPCDRTVKSIAKSFGSRLGIRSIYPFNWKREVSVDAFEEGMTLLLLSKMDSLKKIRKILTPICTTLPQKIYILNLIRDSDFFSDGVIQNFNASSIKHSLC